MTWCGVSSIANATDQMPMRSTAAAPAATNMAAAADPAKRELAAENRGWPWRKA